MKKMEDAILDDEKYKKFCLAILPQTDDEPVQCDKEKGVLSVVDIMVGPGGDINTVTQE
jgi:hypothetical protein